MNRKKKFFALTLLTSVLMVFVTPAFAERDGKYLKHLSQQMDLTEEQQEKIKALHSNGGDQMKTQRELMRAAHEDLEQAMKSAATDDEIRAKYNQLEKLQAEFSKSRFEKVLAVRAILTPEQRLKFKGMGHGEFKRHKRNRK